MSILPGLLHPTLPRSLWILFLGASLGVTLPLGSAACQAQDGESEEEVGEGALQYVPATKLLPESTAGLLRIPNFPALVEAWEQTHIGQLTEEPAMKPFLEAQKKRAKNFANSPIPTPNTFLPSPPSRLTLE